MKIRAKISYMALVQRMTIVELIVSRILKTFRQLETQGYFPKKYEKGE